MFFPPRILITDSTNLQFAAEIRITDKDPGALWLMSSRFHKIFLETLDPSDINIRIMRMPNVVEHRQQRYSSHSFLNDKSSFHFFNYPFYY
jgi:Major royal jelly protein